MKMKKKIYIKVKKITCELLPPLSRLNNLFMVFLTPFLGVFGEKHPDLPGDLLLQIKQLIYFQTTFSLISGPISSFQSDRLA